MLLLRVAATVRFAAGRAAALQQSSLAHAAPGAAGPPLLTIYRPLRTSVITCMGRRSAKIATRKGAQDMKRSKLYGKLGKLILQAAKGPGGPDPIANARLRDALALAKQANCPKDIIDRNVKKASDKSVADFQETLYEAYGPGGTGLLIAALTDSPNRAASDLRTVFAKMKGGAKLAESGSVSFSFTRVGVITLEPAPGLDEDTVLAAAADAGAEDVVAAPGGRWRVTAPPAEFGAVRDALAGAGLAIAADASGLEYAPNTTVALSDEDLEANESLIEKLLALDDVDAVYCSGEGVMEEGEEEE